jgi:hypothetical protein
LYLFTELSEIRIDPDTAQVIHNCVTTQRLSQPSVTLVITFSFHFELFPQQDGATNVDFLLGVTGSETRGRFRHDTYPIH